MFKYFLFLCLGVSFSAYAHEERSDGRIVGGHLVEITAYPHQVSLLYNGKHYCGGSIIGDGSFILTAAHCVQCLRPEEITVRAGSTYHDEGGQSIAVERFEKFDRRDIAVLRLAKNIIIGPKAKPIKLNTKKINLKQTATVTGWGTTAENGVGSRQLQAVSVNFFNQAYCNNAYGIQIVDSDFCAGDVRGGRDSCQGDSGGPLVANGVLVGIVSFGIGCGRPNYPGVYVDVAKLGTWIEETKVALTRN